MLNRIFRSGAGLALTGLSVFVVAWAARKGWTRGQ